MAPPLDGKIDILTAPPPSGQVTITLDGTAGDVLAGGNGQSGAVLVRNGDNKTIVRLASTTLGRPQVGLGGGSAPAVPSGGIAIQDVNGQAIISLTTLGDVVVGGNGVAGDIVLKAKEGQTSVSLRSAGNSQGISIRDAAGKEIVSLQGEAPENIRVCDHSGKPVFNFVGEAYDNKSAALWIGTHTVDGGKKPALVVLRGSAGNDAIVLNGGAGENIFVRDAKNRAVFNFAGEAFDGKIAGLWIGAPRSDEGEGSRD